MLSLCVLAWFQTVVGGDYYTGEYDYTTVDGSQPETPTETAGQGQVTFLTYFSQVFEIIHHYGGKYSVHHWILSSNHPIEMPIPIHIITGLKLNFTGITHNIFLWSS